MGIHTSWTITFSQAFLGQVTRTERSKFHIIGRKAFAREQMLFIPISKRKRTKNKNIRQIKRQEAGKKGKQSKTKREERRRKEKLTFKQHRKPRRRRRYRNHRSKKREKKRKKKEVITVKSLAYANCPRGGAVKLVSVIYPDLMQGGPSELSKFCPGGGCCAISLGHISWPFAGRLVRREASIKC